MGLLKEPRLVSEADLAVLRVNAITDPLTGLYNRRFLIDHLSREISRAERSGGVLPVDVMDLKDFKAINDRLGHPVGDSVLVRTARIMRDTLRTVDAGCRWGGDEFVLVLPNTDMISAFAGSSASAPGSPRSRAVARGLGLHYGVASYPTDGKRSAFLLKIADLRLYQCRDQSSFAAWSGASPPVHARGDERAHGRRPSPPPLDRPGPRRGLRRPRSSRAEGSEVASALERGASRRTSGPQRQVCV